VVPNAANKANSSLKRGAILTVQNNQQSEGHEYDTHFYGFLASFAARSAEQIVPLLTASLPIKSVADFGCGQGAWLRVWREAGASVMGVDGAYVDRQHLMIDQHQFRAADLSRPIDLGGRYDLVQSLEVAEHLPSDCAADFVATLTAHAPLVMFSAAVPGQGGEHHVNEQPLEYWRKKFRDRGYVAVDYIRPQIVENPQIQHWYRYNIVLYAPDSYLEAAPERLRAFRVPEHQQLRNYWPLSDRIRHALVRLLPRQTVDQISRLKTRLASRKAGL
jgi:SAM-dependent methyltransferase